MSLREFEVLRGLIHRETGIYLRDGKQVMLAGRLADRLRQHDLGSYAAYAKLLTGHKDGGKELAAMINCITTNKTAFFREAHHFDFLTHTLVPALAASARLGRKRHIRAWSAACSTGEEPYSIAISLLEGLQSAYAQAHVRSPFSALSPGGWRVEVVGSDIDTVVLAKAADGVYAQESVEDLPSALVRKYFLRGRNGSSGKVRLKQEITGMVKFLRINLMDTQWAAEPPFDVIFFRNALIYFNRETQESFLRKMLQRLKPGGYLVLGHSEHVPWLHDSVRPLGNTIHQLLPQRRSQYTGPDRRRRPRGLAPG